MYLDCLKRGYKGAGKSPWTLVLPIFYLAVSMLTTSLMAPLGFVGGFVSVIVDTFCLSSLLYYVAQAVQMSRAQSSELGKSFLQFFWPIMSYGFVMWIITQIFYYGLAANPQRGVILLGLSGIIAVLANAVPEVIYQKGNTGGLSILTESIRFIQRYWIEWFLANAVAAGVLVGVSWALLRLPFGLYLIPLIAGAIGYVVLVFRGNLFEVLENTSPYQRRMRYRGGQS
jgi:hypothetical protein